MGRNFDKIDIILIVLISTYLITLFLIILVLVYGKKDKNAVKYKIVNVISRNKYKARKSAKIAQKTQEHKKPKTKPNKNETNTRYKGKSATKKKSKPRKKVPKTNGKNKKRKN